MSQYNSWVLYHKIVTKAFSVSSNILYIMQETFLNQNIDTFWKNIKIKERLRWVSFLILLISAISAILLILVICKQRKLYENKVEPEMSWNSLGPFWKALVKIEQLRWAYH